MKKMSTLSIHQPNFLPWLGFFDKINSSSTFYVFDHVAVTMGKGRHSRVMILLNGKEHWLTTPTQKTGKSGQRYCDIKIQDNRSFIKKHLGTIKQAYGKAPHFKEIYADIEKMYSAMQSNLCDFNIYCIRMISQKLNVDCEFVRTSNLLDKYPELDLKSGNDLVLSLAKISGCKEYLSGTGCLDFIMPETFQSNDVEFRFQEFVNPPYPQLSKEEFIGGLSIIDAAMNIGWDGIMHLLNENKC